MHDEKVANFLNNEKAISLFKIKTLRSKDLTPSKKRNLDIELEFVSLNFNLLCLEKLSDAQDAINLYRNSRHAFFQKYPQLRSSAACDMKSNFLLIEIEKLKNKILQANCVQDPYFFNMLPEQKKSLDIAALSIAEGSKISRRRAKYQIALMSLAKYLRSYSSEQQDEFIAFIESAKYELFHYFNESIQDTINLTADGTGSNQYIAKTKKLINLLSEYKVINYRGKSYLSFPIDRVGNEKIFLLSRKIFSNGADITKKFNWRLSNIKLNEKYFLALKSESIANNITGSVVVPASRREAEEYSKLIKKIHSDVDMIISDYISTINY